MKISTNNIIKSYTDLRLHTKENSAPSVVTPNNDSHKFDALIIQSKPRQIEEHTFAKSVSRQLSAEVSQTASAEKLQSLQNEISGNIYQIDAHAIASKMLLV